MFVILNNLAAQMKQIVTLGGVGVPIFSVKVLARLFDGVLGTPGQIVCQFYQFWVILEALGALVGREL